MFQQAAFDGRTRPKQNNTTKRVFSQTKDGQYKPVLFFLIVLNKSSAAGSECSHSSLRDCRVSKLANPANGHSGSSRIGANAPVPWDAIPEILQVQSSGLTSWSLIPLLSCSSRFGAISPAWGARCTCKERASKAIFVSWGCGLKHSPCPWCSLNSGEG